MCFENGLDKSETLTYYSSISLKNVLYFVRIGRIMSSSIDVYGLINIFIHI